MFTLTLHLTSCSDLEIAIAALVTSDLGGNALDSMVIEAKTR